MSIAECKNMNTDTIHMLVSVNFELPTVLKLQDLSVKIYTDTSVTLYTVHESP